MKSLAPKFDHVVVAIKESKNLSTLTKEELQGALESHEQRMNERAAGKSKSGVALQAHSKKETKDKGKCFDRGRGGYNNRMVEETRSKETCRIKEDHTKATKEVVLQIEEDLVVENLIRVTFNVTIVRSMVTIRVIVQKSERIKKVMQSLKNMKKKKR